MCIRDRFHYVRMAQTRKGAEDEGVTVDARPVVGEPDIHHGLPAVSYTHLIRYLPEMLLFALRRLFSIS